MRAITGLLGMSLGGAVGWWLGARVGIMTAFILSVIGSGLGLYLARRWLQDLLP